MSEITTRSNKKEEKEEDNVVEFNKPKLIVNNDSGSSAPINWLMGLEIGTVFRVCTVGDRQNFICRQLIRLKAAEKSVNVWDEVKNELFGGGPVHAERFCRFYELVEVVGKMEEPREEETKEETDGDGNRLQGNASPEGGSLEHSAPDKEEH